MIDQATIVTPLVECIQPLETLPMPLWDDEEQHLRVPLQNK